MPETIVHFVFVYGTLKRGQCRENLWPAKPLSVRQASVAGELYDRDDYPAMKRGDDRILGEIWEFDSSTIQRVVETLDQIECTQGNSPDDLYHRHQLDATCHKTGEQIRCVAYFYVRNPVDDGFVKLDPDENGHVQWPPTSR